MDRFVLSLATDSADPHEEPDKPRITVMPFGIRSMSTYELMGDCCQPPHGFSITTQKSDSTNCLSKKRMLMSPHAGAHRCVVPPETGNWWIRLEALKNKDRTRRPLPAAQETRSGCRLHTLIDIHRRIPNSDAAVSVSSLRNQVLEMEPWNEERHVSGRGAVWHDCGQRVPGLLKDNNPEKNRRLVQCRIFRMARQLNDPKAGHHWKSCPDVKQRVENVAAKLATEFRFTRQRQGPVEHKNSTLATVEKAHAIPEQPATVQQRQRQGAAERKNIVRLAVHSFIANAEQVSAS